MVALKGPVKASLLEPPPIDPPARSARSSSPLPDLGDEAGSRQMIDGGQHSRESSEQERD
ncbi:hypothetical protein E2562_026871 [Oryza meyeriana var. granulata]|uniref:Uncharacterized protein n=1 Tax=Oryza meyeriana var. granulata TaxID=110450 RepID=A0A6G1D898_9ORYZ|nr:hypothetical protein E2562_026871 [Oryza meyeriana var. granulata]